MALESHLEGTCGPTWTSLGGHLEAILKPLGAQVGSGDTQKGPKRFQVEPKGVQEAPS